MKLLRTPDECFANLKDYPFEPNYTTIQTEDGSDLRIHHLDEGSKDGPLVLCMHGQPVWSYLYRKMIPLLVKEGMRVIVPDLPGYGKSDKPAAREDYSYQRQVDWMGQWLAQNDFSNITFFGQDWGGLIGLRLVVDQEVRFDRVVISNTGLPYSPDVDESTIAKVNEFRTNAKTPSLPEMQKALRDMQKEPPIQFAYWQKFCWETEDLPIGFMMSMSMEKRSMPGMALRFVLQKMGLDSLMQSDLAKGYAAPFPDPSYKMGPRAMPSHVPTIPDDSLEAQARAWDFFAKFEKPFVCAFADNDPVSAGAGDRFKAEVPGAQGREHPTIKGGGHFVQENAPQQVVNEIVSLIRSAG